MAQVRADPPSTSVRADHPQAEVASRAELRAWLGANHGQSSSIWLVIWKKGDPRHLPYDALVEEALCFGWIDSLPRKLDAARTMIRLSPRRPGSGWSAVNKARIDRLAAAGQIAAPGLAAIAAAKADGSWQRLNAAGALMEPEALRAVLATQADAMANWQAFPPSARRGMLEWVAQARTAATRDRRIAEIAAEAAQGRRAYPRRPV